MFPVLNLPVAKPECAISQNEIQNPVRVVSQDESGHIYEHYFEAQEFFNYVEFHNSNIHRAAHLIRNPINRAVIVNVDEALLLRETFYPDTLQSSQLQTIKTQVEAFNVEQNNRTILVPFDNDEYQQWWRQRVRYMTAAELEDIGQQPLAPPITTDEILAYMMQRNAQNNQALDEQLRPLFNNRWEREIQALGANFDATIERIKQANLPIPAIVIPPLRAESVNQVFTFQWPLPVVENKIFDIQPARSSSVPVKASAPVLNIPERRATL